MKNIKYIFFFFLTLSLSFGQSSHAVFSLSGSNTFAGFINNNTTGISIAITYDTGNTGAGANATWIRGVYKTDADPSALNDANYTRTMNVTWPTQNGVNSGAGSFYGENRASGTTHTVNVSLAQLETIIGAGVTSGRLYIAIQHGSTYDQAGISGASIKGGTTYYYFEVDRLGPVLTGIKLFKDPSQGTEQSINHNLFINSYKIKYTVGAEAIVYGFIKYECVSGGCSTTNTGSGGAKSAGGNTYKDAWNNQESANTTYTYATDPTLTHGAVYNISMGVMDTRLNYNVYGVYNNITYLNPANPLTVQSVTAADAELKLNETADITVTFSGVVVVDGTPTLTFTETSPSWTEAENLTSGSGTNALVFRYTVDSDHYSTSLRYTATDALSAGTSIRDKAGNNVTRTLPAAGASGSLDANSDIEVDGIVPAAFQVQSLVTTGGLVKAGKWNSTNTGLSAGVEIKDDASLIGGKVQLSAESTGTYRTLGAQVNIPAKNTTQNVTASAEGTASRDVEELENTAELTDGEVITMKAIIEDNRENTTTGSAATTTLTVDQTVPTVAGVDGDDGNYKLGDQFDVTVTFTETMDVSGTPKIILKTDNTPGSTLATVDMSSSNDRVLTFEYTVGATHYSQNLAYSATTSLSEGTYLRDVAWNPATLTLANVGATNSLSASSTIKVDGVAPAAFNTGTVITVGAPVVANYLNGDNTHIKVTVPIANDASLENGKLYIQAKIGGNAYANVSSAYTIQAGDLGTNKEITIAESDIDSNGELTGFSEGAVITFTGLLEDYAKGAGGTGNQTTGTGSSTTLTVDQTDPTAFTTGSVTTVGAPVVTGKWNKHNTDVNVVVPVANDATLEDGYIQLIAKTASSNYEDVGDSVQIANGNLNGNVTITLTAAQFEAIDNNLSDGDVVTINARIDDVAGNATIGTASSTTLTVDQTSPTVDEVTSDANDGLANPYKVGTTVNIKVSFSEVVDVVPGTNKPALQLDTDDTPGSVLSEAIYNAGTGSKYPLFRLTVATNNYSEDLNYRATTSLILNDGTIRDAAGNNATLTLPALDDAKSLKNKKTLWIDGVLPAIKTVGAVTTTGDTIVTAYWNKINTGLTVVVPLETTDFSLRSGTIQLEAQAVGGGVTGNWTNIGAVTTMTTETVGAGTQTISVAKRNTASADFEEINEFSDGDVVTIRAVVTDLAGNSSTFTASNTTLTVDHTYPSTSTTFKPADAKSALTCCSAADDAAYGQYWNEDHGAVNITVPFKNDPTLEGGYLQFQARAGAAGAWTPVGYRKTITSAQVAAAAPLKYGFDTNTQVQARTQPDGTANVGGQDEQEFGIDKIDSFANGLELYFRVMVADVAGNSIYSDISDITIYIEERSATIKEVTSTNDDGAYKAADKINITVESTADFLATPNMTVTGTPQLSLETGDVRDAVANYASGTGTDKLTFEYTVAAGDSSLDLNYLSTTALALNGGTILGPYGNDVTLTLPALANASALKQKKDIEIDTRALSVTFTYDDPDSLVRFEDGEMVITATFNDDLEAGTVPKLTVDFPTSTAGDKTNVSMTKTSGKVFTYKLPLVDNSDGLIAVSVSAKDKALNALTTTVPADSVHADTIITIDNTDPVAFTTGLATLFGDTVSGSWFNKSTDSVKIVVPIDVTDESLLRGNIQVQMQVDGKMTSNSWVTILPKDTLQILTGSVPKYRTKKEVLDILTPQKLAQGDSVFIRAVINDQVGNVTIGATSASFFILDTLPPAIPAGKDVLITLTDEPDTTISNLQGESIFLTSLRDTLWTNDSLVFATQNWEDPKLDTEVLASGIQRYQYTIFESASNDKNGTFTTFRSYQFQTDTLDTVIIAIDSLTHNRWYYPELQAVDVAGNTSITATYYKTFRYNARPIVDTIPDVTAREDVLWEELIKANDKDLLTLRSDVFSYALTVMKLDPTQTPIDSAVVDPATIAAEVTANGKVIFTPTKLDTASFVFRVIVTDNWTLKDTVDIDITVLPVNDPPILDLSSIAKMIFLEGANSDSINLTRYAYDEDNDTTDLKFSFRITSTLPDKGGYPTAKIGFLSNFNDGYKQSFISKLVDEFPSSTIVQKNNAFLIYPASVHQFRDPIKVDLLVKSDSTFAWITPTDTSSNDTNYFTSSDMLLEFTVTDPSDSVGKDTVTFFINPLNDPPVWTSLPDTTIKENDSLYFDFADYLTDVDDSTLTISILPLTFGDNITIEPTPTYNIKPSGIEYLTTTHKDTVKFKPDLLWFGPNGPMVKNKTDSILIQITAADDDTSAIDTFIVYVQRVPRPEIRMYVVQNNAFTNYYEIFLVDSVGKTKDLTLKIQSKTVTLDTAAAFTYVGHYNFKTKGTYTFEVDATGVVGDTSVTKNLGLALAKMYATWSGRSADGQFQVIGKNGVVDFDQSVMILDSTLFEPYFNDRASYLLGNEAFRFKKSVEISMPGENEEVAIYQRSTGTGWIELPSITQGNRVMAYTEKMGYFRMGPKTLLVPGQTALQQNYPNPFNPVTTLEYDLGFVDGPYQKVSMTIYDILGRNVKTLVNEQQSIGRYRLKWNGKDQNGANVASGIYFVHLLTDMGRSQTKKIMLVR